MALILFIDDDMFSRALYAKACTILGHLSLLADSGQLGLTMAGERQPNLIVLDLSLPDQTGLQVLAQLRQGNRTAHIPVVIVSAGVSDQDPQISQAAGAVAYINKPVGLNTLQNAIDQFAN
jgi:CheY-like chemotaxis protein